MQKRSSESRGKAALASRAEVRMAVLGVRAARELASAKRDPKSRGVPASIEERYLGHFGMDRPATKGGSAARKRGASKKVAAAKKVTAKSVSSARKNTAKKVAGRKTVSRSFRGAG